MDKRYIVYKFTDYDHPTRHGAAYLQEPEFVDGQVIWKGTIQQLPILIKHDETSVYINEIIEFPEKYKAYIDFILDEIDKKGW